MRQARGSRDARQAGIWLPLTLAALWLAGCASSNTPAPVVERSTMAALPPATPGANGDLYTVKKGDTLYSIALDHGQSYRDLAAWNNLENPNKIQVDQQLRVIAPPAKESESPVAVAKPVNVAAAPTDSTTKAASRNEAAASELLKREPKGGKQPYSAEVLARMQKAETLPEPQVDAGKAVTEKPADKPLEKSAEKPTDKAVSSAAGDEAVDWAWPASGKLLAGFSEGSNKGLDISGKPGEPVLAAAAGKVILVSSALRGYGNFVIIKHNPTYLSVYAHNSRVLVKEEQTVSKGQKIAEIGSSDSDQPKLHFEIRRQGKPIDPGKFLPAR